MLGEETKVLYIYTVTAPPEVFDYLENSASRKTVDGLFYRARRKKREQLEIRKNKYMVHYDSTFHYHIYQVFE